MKIWFQLPVKMEAEDPAFKPFFKLLRKDFELVKRSDTEIVAKDVESGLTDPDHLGYLSLRFLNEREILKSVIRAEAQGFDGVIIGCYFDPALRAARQLLNIPVTGLAESSMYLACMMGLKFATITTDSRYIPEMVDALYKYGVYPKAIARNPVRTLTLSPSELFGCFGGDSTPAIENFKEIALGCIEDGAEVLIAGCGLLSPLLTQGGLKEVEKAAVVDPILVSVKMAEILVDLYKAGIPVVSHRGLYLGAPLQDLKEAMGSLSMTFP